jgi:hypothetical protein
MKTILLVLTFVSFMATLSFAQYTGQLSPAVTVAKGTARGLADIGIYDGALGLFGEYRYGIGGIYRCRGEIGFCRYRRHERKRYDYRRRFEIPGDGVAD